MNEEELEKVLQRVLNSHRTIDNKTHELHHRAVQRYLDRCQRRQELWQKFKLSFVGALAVGATGFLAWIGKLILEALKRQ